MLVSREPQSVEMWHWRLEPGSRYHAQPDIDGTDVLVLVTRGTLAMTVDGQTTSPREPPATSPPSPAINWPMPPGPTLSSRSYTSARH